jgi:Xaa-Pro dipeptidase
MNLDRIQEALREEGLEAWLFYDMHHRDRIGYRILGLPPHSMCTRRWFYVIPAYGEPRKLVHRIESKQLDPLPGPALSYTGWQEMHCQLDVLLHGLSTVAMQYSPLHQLPSLSLVDSGTVELVRELGKTVVSSADLLQQFEARCSPAALASHLKAGRHIHQIIHSTFDEIGRPVASHEQTDEYSIQQFILDKFHAHGLISKASPLVSVNQNTDNPHYQPTSAGSIPISRGDFVLLDVWAKQDKPGAVFYDVTWCGFWGSPVPDRIAEIFAIMTQARDRALETVQLAFAERRPLRGYEVDRTACGVIEESGYGNYFSTAPDTPSASRSTDTERIWTIWKRMTPGYCSRTPVFPSSRASICRSSA